MLKTINQHENEKAVYGRKLFWIWEKKDNRSEPLDKHLAYQTQQLAMSWKWKKPTCLLSDRHWNGRLRKTIAVDVRNIVIAVRKFKKKTVTSPTDLWVKVSQSNIQRSHREQKYRGNTTRGKHHISNKNRKISLNFQRSTVVSKI